jgi:hypothetical protein
LAIFLSTTDVSTPDAHDIAMSDANFVSCSNSQLSGGTVYQENGMISSYARLNFSWSVVHLTNGLGSAFSAGSSTTGPTTGHWSFDFCTFLDCTGRAIFSSSLPSITAQGHQLTHCNFYRMSVGGSGGVANIGAEAIVVSFCYFGYLSGGNLFSNSNGKKFVVTDCFFENGTLNSDRVSATTRNAMGFGFTSLPISHYDGCYYPSPTQTVGHSRTPTPTCQVLIGQFSRVLAEDGLCYQIERSVFSRLSSVTKGGAIYVQYSSEVYVLDTTFESCPTSDSGGAITINEWKLEVVRCCFLACPPSSDQQFILNNSRRPSSLRSPISTVVVAPTTGRLTSMVLDRRFVII